MHNIVLVGNKAHIHLYKMLFNTITCQEDNIYAYIYNNSVLNLFVVGL